MDRCGEGEEYVGYRRNMDRCGEGEEYVATGGTWTDVVKVKNMWLRAEHGQMW